MNGFCRCSFLCLPLLRHDDNLRSTCRPKTGRVRRELNSEEIVKSTKDPISKQLAVELSRVVKSDIAAAGQIATKIVETTKDVDSKWMAIRILGNLQHQPAVPLFLKGLEDPHHYVRANSARALGDMKVITAAPALIVLLDKEKDGGVLQQTSMALVNLHASEAVPALKRAAKHDDIQTRIWILQAVDWEVRDGRLLLLLSDPSTPASSTEAINLTGEDRVPCAMAP